MTPAEAAKAVQDQVEMETRQIGQKAMARLPRAAAALRNAELTVLSGNTSPSPPGSPPGRRSGVLRNSWTMEYKAGGMSGTFGITSNAHYAGYLEDGTSKMAARPFVDKIQETAEPQIVSIFGEIGG